MNDIIALLAFEFDQGVDRISREMFVARLAEYEWAQQPANTWTLVFDPRSRTSMRQTVQNHLDLACQFARIKRGQVRAIVHFGEEEPTAL